MFMYHTIYTILRYDIIHTIRTSISYNSLTLPICPYHTKLFFYMLRYVHIDNCASINHLILCIYYMKLKVTALFCACACACESRDWTQKATTTKKSEIYWICCYTWYVQVFFFLKSFNLWHLLLMISLYQQTKTPMHFNM